MIRFATLTMGGEGYLNFMGNEFGHPEWIDFPREGNGWRYFYCRRQWHLADDRSLRYCDLEAFDRAMLAFAKEKKLFKKAPSVLFIDANAQVLVFERAGVVFAFNFSPSNSYEGYWLTLPKTGHYQVIFSTDEPTFGGFDRISKDYIYTAKKDAQGVPKAQIYLPSRTALCLGRASSK
jgi:1,4-alpha-glucan branching enzyme